MADERDPSNPPEQILPNDFYQDASPPPLPTPLLVCRKEDRGREGGRRLSYQINRRSVRRKNGDGGREGFQSFRNVTVDINPPPPFPSFACLLDYRLSEETSFPLNGSILLLPLLFPPEEQRRRQPTTAMRQTQAQPTDDQLQKPSSSSTGIPPPFSLLSRLSFP